MRGRLLIVDDEPLKRIALQIELSEQGYEVREAETATAALRLLDDAPADALVADAQLPDLNGLDLLARALRTHPRVAVILTSAAANVETAVLAIQRGAWDFLVKPFTTHDLLLRLERLFAARPAQDVSEPERADAVETFGPLLAAGAGLRRLFEQARRAALADFPMLLCGETGVGKTALAAAIHAKSKRKNGPFTRFDCAAPATPDAALEELLGREKTGARTSASGAARPRAGWLAQADGGTLLLSNIHALPLPAQAALVRFLESREFQRIGAKRSATADVRIIGATAHDLSAFAGQDRFRADLHSRLNGCSLTISPLRERPADIAALARHFLEKYAAMLGRRTLALAPAALEELLRRPWPGNVRELAQTLERAAVFCAGDEICLEHVLPPERMSAATSMGPAGHGPQPLGLNEAVAELERRMILLALQRCDGNQGRAAQRLGVPRTTLRDKMVKYGLSPDEQALPDRARPDQQSPKR